MRIDLFELIEGLFRGIVYFIYNVVETTVMVVRHPLRGPLLLERLHRRPGARQIGGMTFLFLAMLLLLWVLVGAITGQGPGMSDVPTTFKGVSIRAPSFDFDTVWPLFFGSIVGTVIIDAILRLILRWRLGGYRAARKRILAASEFAMLWMVIPAVLFICVASIYLWFEPHPGPSFYFLGALCVLGGAVPASVVLQPAGPSIGPAGQRHFMATASRVFGVALLFTLATYAGSDLTNYGQQRQNLQRYEDASALIQTLRCASTSEGHVEVDGLIYITDGEPLVFEETAFSLSFATDNSGWMDDQDLTWRRPSPNRLLLVSEAQPAVVELRTTRPFSGPEDATRCILTAWNVAAKHWTVFDPTTISSP